MVGDEESDGARGLRLWAAGATERAGALIHRVGNGSVSAEEFDGPVAELTQLRHLLDHDRALLGRVTLGLGALLAVRHVSGHGSPEDRDEALGLLDEVRDPTTAAGEAVSEQGRQWAAMFLLMVTGRPAPGGAAGAPPDFWSAFDRSREAGPDEGPAEAAELAALAAEARQLTISPDVQAQLGQMQDMLSYASRGDFSDPGKLLTMLPANFPFTEQLRMLLGLLTALPDAAEPQPCAQEAEQDPEADNTVNGAWLAAMLGTSEALRTGDPEALSRLLQRLGGDLDQLPDGHGRASEVQNVIRLVLQTGEPLGGSRVDGTVAREHTKSVNEHYERLAADDPATAEFAVGLRASNLLTRMRAAEEAENGEDLLGLVAELDALEKSTPAGHPFRSLVLLAQGTALTSLGGRTRDSELLMRGLAQQEEALTDVSAGDLGIPESLLAATREGLQAARAVTGKTPDLLPERVPLPPDASTDTRYFSALSATLRHSVTHDPADLDTAIDELEQVRDRVRQGRWPQVAADALWQLAENHRLRLRLTGDTADRDAATESALESLQALAGDVVLQSGPDHGLLAARSGADRGMRAAVWAASEGRVEDSVAALELGRALVLQAASTSQAVPDLLEARGHHELARAWRAKGGGAGGEPDVLPRALPSSLRRRALEALGHREPGGVLFHTPTVDELKAGVAEAEADALVYLLAGEGATPGMAIVVGPDTGTGVRALPLLSGEESGPLERYVDAAGEYGNRPGEPSAVEAWEDALAELCAWATGAVIAPVMSGVAERLAANRSRRRDRPGPPRIVLVPCGRLGLVPWHAARLPAGAPHDYVCQAMVISYAASGRQFLNTVRLARRAPAASPVLLADPTITLTHAELEVAALQQSLYPGARLFGEFYEPPAELAGAGTPDDLLDALGSAPSLVHLACHGSAGTSPTASVLQLAAPVGPSGQPPDSDGQRGETDTGTLTVSRLLSRSAGGQGAADGPLVVLSACETDLSKRDHDEALTLTTAFVASGARDVVGSRWATRDSASALMMGVFHHCLAVDGLSPVDALRAAQMWMLDPHRRNPGSLAGKLLDELDKGPKLERLTAWAAFIHQGHPGPSAPPPSGAAVN
ncbi:CHAT domain-containing protein [Streptomyces sp. NBC_01520]|uniref:CHAT domain-containing protein n=1 Tax=Streptomyces sp. NBC_01520 TaxID=2903892 RepID=UPI0038680261